MVRLCKIRFKIDSVPKIFGAEITFFGAFDTFRVLKNKSLVCYIITSLCVMSIVFTKSIDFSADR